MKGKIDFQDGRHGGHLGLPIETILAFFFFTYKLPRYFLPCFETIGLSVQEKKRPGTILAVFDLQGPDTSYQFSSQLAFCFR